jgi:Transposase DDE domain/Insertion element 4 transposase N-terminal
VIQFDKEVEGVLQLPSDERLRALKRIIPKKTVQAILRKARSRQRYCKRLPGWFMIWFLVTMGLYFRDDYCQVFRWMQGKGHAPGRSTICMARHSLGIAPLRLLHLEIVRLLADADTPGAFYRDMRLMAIDGFVLDLPDRPELARVFGRPKGGRTPGAFPQARVLGLCEIGTHVIWRHLIKPIRCGEVTMADTLLRYLQKDMLLLWDRGFLSYANLAQVIERQGHLLARLKSNLIFKPLRTFADGSYLAKMYPSSWAREQDRHGLTVRILKYTFNDPGRPGSGVEHRLLTTLLHPSKDSAKTLIELYHQRWELELAIDELKTHQQEQRTVLRSETPAGVIQEIEGLLLSHYVVRTVMFEAAQTEALDPRRISFTATLKILRCRLPQCPRGRKGLLKWYADLMTEVAKEKLPPRRDRVNPRVVKRKMSKWAKKRALHYNYSQPTKKFRQSINMLD